MKKLTITLTVLISLNVFSQEKKMFSTELNEFVLQCENIGRTITDKNKATDITEWYDGRYKEITKASIKQLESDIDNAIADVTYNLTKVKETPLLIYRLHFFNKETKEKFGQLFISFRKKEDDLVDFLTFISKERMGIIDLDISDNSSLFNTPTPSLNKN